MKAIILAAGMGTRLHDVSKGLPKSLLKINDSTILDRQIEACLSIGISSFVIVVGYMKDVIIKHLNKYDNLNFDFVINEQYKSTNTLYSLYLAKDFFTEDFVYFNADVLFDEEILGLLNDKSCDAQLLLDNANCAEEEVKIVLQEGRIIEIGKQIDPAKCIGEFIGIARFNKHILNDFVKELKYGIDHGQENNYFEYAVNRLCSYNVLEVKSIGSLRAIEIDFPEDFSRAMKLFS